MGKKKDSKKIQLQMISCMAEKDLKCNRLKNGLVMITIILTSALLCALGMFAMGQKEDFRKQVSNLQQVSYYHLNEEQVNKLKADERIAYQVVVKQGIPLEQQEFCIVPYYISELSDEIYITQLQEGKLPEKENEIVVPKAILKYLGVNAQIGDTIDIPFYDGGVETFRISGFLEDSEDTNTCCILCSQTYAETGKYMREKTYEVYAKLYGAQQMEEEECKELMYLIGNDAQVERKNISPTKAFLESLSMDSNTVLLQVLVGGIVLISCILVIYGVFYLAVIGNIRHFGQLRTIGMSRKQIRKMIQKEGKAIFRYAIFIGLAIGGICGYVFFPKGFHLGNTVVVMIVVFLLVYAIVKVSILKPARLAANISPIEAVRYTVNDTTSKKRRSKRNRALNPVALGIMNFGKNRKKAIIMILSLGMGGILFMAAATYISSFNKEDYSRQGDFKNAEFKIAFSTSAIETNEYGSCGIQIDNPLSAELMDNIRSIDGVKEVNEVKGVSVAFDVPVHDEYGTEDIITPLSEKETKEIHNYLEEGEEDYEKLMSGDYLLVTDNDTVEEIYGWRFQVGDAVTIKYFDGHTMQSKEMSVIGILNEQYIIDKNGVEGWFIMPESTILDMADYSSLNVKLLISTEKDKETFVGEKLDALLSNEKDLTMETLAARQKKYNATVNRLFASISGLAIFIMLFSVLSMLNTLITNIVVRKKELAMLESIAMSRSQIRTMLLSENLIMVMLTLAITLTIGTSCGYILCQWLHRMGATYMVFSFPIGYTVVYSAFLVFIPFSVTMIAIYRFAKEPLVERLRGMD